MTLRWLAAWAREAAAGTGIGEAAALELGDVADEDVALLFPVTRSLRRKASGNKVFLCSIVNAKSGRCGEDCRFCAQSAHWRTDTPEFPLRPYEEIMDAARAARGSGAGEFSIVTSGKGVSAEAEVARIEAAIAGVRSLGMESCVSPGIVDRETMARWQAAGLNRFHHNLEAAPSFIGQVRTTRPLTSDIAAVRAAKELGLKVCAGGIFGMGESWAQRVELGLLLRELAVESVPLNFLNPIPGTPMAETAPGVRPWEALKTIALFRLLLPAARIILCGGREVNLRQMQAFMFEAGANGILIGNYLTTSGRPAADDLELIRDLGMEPAPA